VGVCSRVVYSILYIYIITLSYKDLRLIFPYCKPRSRHVVVYKNANSPEDDQIAGTVEGPKMNARGGPLPLPNASRTPPATGPAGLPSDIGRLVRRGFWVCCCTL
jgi:hypothetical protein